MDSKYKGQVHILLCFIRGPAASSCSSRDLVEVVQGSPKLNKQEKTKKTNSSGPHVLRATAESCWMPERQSRDQGSHLGCFGSSGQVCAIWSSVPGPGSTHSPGYHHMRFPARDLKQPSSDPVPPLTRPHSTQT